VRAASSISIAPRVSCFPDTCNVYVLRSGTEAILVDFGDGNVLDHVEELGVERVTDVLLTHHHRDQLGGLRRAVDAGIRIWTPAGERELIEGMDDRWRSRQTMNDYDLREDRFSLLESVPVTGTVDEYRTVRFGDLDVFVLPTPGHTMGSVSYLVELDGRRLAFTGDLVYGDGKVWSLAASQWTYSGVEGWGATIISTATLGEQGPDLLLPSHGDPVDDPPAALGKLAERMQGLIDLRDPRRWNVAERLRAPFEPITPHLLRNRTMFATNYALVSDDGRAFLIDFGYDVTCTAPSTERVARRTLLWSLSALAEPPEAVIVTHYHDDHVAGLNLLRDVLGVEVWAPENVAPIIASPERYDLPCLWFDPIPVDRVIEFGKPVQWHEHELTVYPLPGHTRYAAAISFEVDGTKVLLTGDQQTDEGSRSILNYQYRNRFVPQDFSAGTRLYRRLRPDLLLGGHWLPLAVTDDLLFRLEADAQRLTELHAELLPEEGFGTEGFGARIEPYRSPPGTTEFAVSVWNPFDRAETATVVLDGQERRVELGPHAEATVTFTVTSDGPRRIAADLTVGGTRFGQQAEAIIE
jgi:glyoxylase-like metal-dependent hydrolase (beta-lactamase superfamily II)